MRCSLFKFLILFMLSGIFLNCARRGTPTGGPKDSIPPILVKAIPNIESINFDDYPFTIVAFENFFDDPCEKIKSAIGNSTHVYLTSYGYILQSICGPTYIYIKYKR